MSTVSATATTQQVVSLILIATASLLIDRSLRHDRVTWQRLECQVWLWLALVLSIGYSRDDTAQQEEEEVTGTLLFENWLHCVIFSTITSIFAQTQQQYDHERGGRRMIMVGHRRRIKGLAAVTTFMDWMPGSAWCAMISSAVPLLLLLEQEDTDAMVLWTCQVFVISLAIQWALQWHWHRKARTAAEVQAIPTTTTMNNARTLSSSAGRRIELDESQWHSWNVAQTWQWVSQVLVVARMGDEDPDDDEQCVLRRLAPHRIRGTVLDTLTIHRLVETLHIPYGPAAQLFQAIEHLTLRYPRPSRNDDHNFTSSTTNNTLGDERQPDWLTLHDREYNQPSSRSDGRTPPATTIVQPSPPPPPPFSDEHQNNHPDDDPEEKMAKIMKERYGLELPTMKTTPNNGVSQVTPENPATSLPPNCFGHQAEDYTNNNNSRHEYPAPTLPLQQELGGRTNHRDGESTTVPPSSSPSATTSCSSGSSFPPSMLAHMPPNIRDIVQRRPDLVEQILDKKKQQQQVSRMTIQEGSDEEHDDLLEDEFDHYDDDDDETSMLNNDETTSLLLHQRRTTTRSKYKSTEQGNNIR